MTRDIDCHIGARLRRRRRLIGITQSALGNAVGVRFQQIQKYECGANVVSAARLWWIALRLGVGMDYFFDGLHSDEQIELGRLPVGLQPAVEVGA